MEQKQIIQKFKIYGEFEPMVFQNYHSVRIEMGECWL